MKITFYKINFKSSLVLVNNASFAYFVLTLKNPVLIEAIQSF